MARIGMLTFMRIIAITSLASAQNHTTDIVTEQNTLIRQTLDNSRFESGKPASGASVDPSQLRLVVVIHRHAERTPVFSIPWGRNVTRQSAIPTDAQLTSRGVKQMYEYGQWIRRRYQAFFETNDRIPSQRITIISSHTDRTITSAQALAAGLLPTENTTRRWDSELGKYWYPIPVYAQPYHDDLYLFNYDDADCPLMGRLRRTINEMPLAKQLEAELADFKRAIMKASGIANYDFWGTTTAIEDAMRYALEYPQTNAIPPWMNTTLLDAIERIAGMRMHLIAGGNGDRQRTRLKTGRLLDDIFHRMEKSTKDNAQNLLKMVFYSCHDENVSAILAALNLFNYTLKGPNFGIPEFTASVIFELFKNNSVRILLKNNAQDECGDPIVLRHPEYYSDFCPLQELRHILDDVIVSKKQFDEECNSLPTGSWATTVAPATPLPSTHIDKLIRDKRRVRPGKGFPMDVKI
ncbi:prostatic acid phosphatase-like [Paramacrobiotus metropolitanus]|uniref:prostatic acid phosphatase-like n=1 Tax=Paramacrobiotus metropolitanus TaxID=2943436 RepID=UPI002445D57E|nr:prostatic acid phosphatase-like [Paramacrobiotus metropolitanus]XP_055344578.1 prostatic acid phosphatase-like [Paramacrobiotus metropolitanus]